MKFFINRKKINIGMILSIVFTGMFLNMYIKFVKLIMPGNITLIGSIVLFFLASIPVSIGFAIMKSARLGVAPNDYLYLLITSYVKKPYSVVRIITDTIYIIFGVLFGGIAGIGTIICIITQGPLIQLFMARVKPTLEGFLVEKNN